MKEKGHFDEIATEIIAPILDKVCEVAFEYIETDSGKTPIGLKEGVLEKLDEVIEYLKDRASYYKGASIIGFALGQDGNAPGKRCKAMAAVTVSLRDLIKAREEQVKGELDSMRERCEHEKQKLMAVKLGFED